MTRNGSPAGRSFVRCKMRLTVPDSPLLAAQGGPKWSRLVDSKHCVRSVRCLEPHMEKLGRECGSALNQRANHLGTSGIKIADVILQVVSSVDQDRIAINCIIRLRNEDELRSLRQLPDQRESISTLLIRMSVTDERPVEDFDALYRITEHISPLSLIQLLCVHDLRS